MNTNYGKEYAAFLREVVDRGFLASPMSEAQFMFLRRDCELGRRYVLGVAMDVASGVSMRHAVLVAIEAYRVDEGLAV